MNALIPIDCAVNDDYGSTTNKVSAIHFPGLELDTTDIGGVHFREVTGGFYVSRRKWLASHIRSCVGNIYWERYGMDPWSAAAFLHYLRKTGLFQPDGGFEELWNWWESGIAADALVRSLLIDAAKEDRL
jgi:hypothetical protein